MPWRPHQLYAFPHCILHRLKAEIGEQAHHVFPRSSNALEFKAITHISQLFAK
jgi:extradiol dioxygenase family protein